jgi:uncharacterized protein (TIGR03083 family)
MSEGATEAIAAMRRSHDEMAPMVEAFSAGDLRAQSGSSEWSVAAVLSHLGSAAEIGRNTLVSRKADMASAQPVWDRWNAMTPESQAANFVVSDRELVEAYEGLSEEELANDRVDVGFLPEPVGIDMVAAMRLSEVALHRWDIEVAFDPAATVAGYLVPPALRLLPAFAGFFAKPSGTAGRVAISTTGPARTYSLELRLDGATLVEGGESGTAGTSLTIPAESLLRLTGGRLDPEHTPAGVTISGELSLDTLRAVFPGY